MTKEQILSPELCRDVLVRWNSATTKTSWSSLCSIGNLYLVSLAVGPDRVWSHSQQSAVITATSTSGCFGCQVERDIFDPIIRAPPVQLSQPSAALRTLFSAELSSASVLVTLTSGVVINRYCAANSGFSRAVTYPGEWKAPDPCTRIHFRAVAQEDVISATSPVVALWYLPQSPTVETEG